MRKLSEVLVKTGAEIYREIIPVALYSVLSSLILIPTVLLLPITAALFVIPFIYMPLFFGVLNVFHHKMERKSRRNGLKDLAAGVRKGYFPAVVMGLFISLLVFILWSTWWYYGGQDGMFYTVIAVFQTYFVIMRSSLNSTRSSLFYRRRWGSSRRWEKVSSCSCGIRVTPSAPSSRRYVSLCCSL